MTTPSHKFHSSGLSRNSASVFAGAEVSPVLVTRRDGKDLVLMTKEEAEATTFLSEFAAQLLGRLPGPPADLVYKMTAIYPWILAPNPVDQEQYTRDLLSATRTALETGQPDRVISDMLSWRETAPATGDGLKSSPNDWRESLQLVDRPE